MNETQIAARLERLSREVRVLRIATVAATLACVVVFTTGFARAPDRQKFEELDVERLNVVDASGGLKLVLSNQARMPDPVIDGKSYPRSGTRSPGILFYNDVGDECGGLAFSGGPKGAGAALLFDQHRQDQCIGLVYEDRVASEPRRRSAGLVVWNRPTDMPISELFARVKEIEAITDKDEQRAALEKLQDSGNLGAKRMFVGRDDAGTAGVFLSDARGQERVALAVGEDGTARLEFKDAEGKVIARFPEK